MENLIFLIFVIIISIISSLVKKKAPPAPPPQKGRNVPDRRPQNRAPQPQSGKEILEEVQKILRGEVPEPEYTYNKAPEPQVTAEKENVQVEEFTDPDFATPAVQPVKTEYEVDQKDYTTDSKFQYRDTRAIEFGKKLRDVNNLREYLIISEILGKPKALKRR